MDKIIEREFFIQFELYRILKGFVLDHSRSKLRDENWADKIKDVFVEVPTDGDRADMVVTIEDDRPLLIIETKRRTKSKEGWSISRKVVQAINYAKKLGSRYYAICNGWILLLFNLYKYPYLLGIYGVNINYDYARNLLVGIAKYYYEGEYDKNMDILNFLPRVPDYFDVEKKIIPAIAKLYHSINDNLSIEELLEAWKKRIKRN